MHSTPQSALRRERWKLTARLVRALDKPMLLLRAVWSVLLVVEFTRGLSLWLQTLNDIIWGAFPTQQILFHDQTEDSDGERGRQREGWPAGQAHVPASRKVADAIAHISESTPRGVARE